MTSVRSHVGRSIACAAIVFVAAGGQAAAAPRGGARITAVRVADRRIEDLLNRSLVRSATLRDLVAQLEQTATIVYIESGEPTPDRTPGRTRFVTTGAGGWRYLRISIDERRSNLDVMSLVAHELQHAVEIAQNPEVVDDASMVGLYQRISSVSGRGVGGSHWFETQAAIDMGRRVYLELFGMI